MTKTANRKSERFVALALIKLDTAFQKRSKAIRHNSITRSIHRESGSSSGGEDESLVVEVEMWEARPTTIRLRVWSDREFWFGAHKAAKSGWAFKLAFNGHLADMADNVVVEKFEESMVLLANPNKSDRTQELVLEVWKETRPVLQDAT